MADDEDDFGPKRSAGATDEATDELLGAVYDELRELARARMAHEPAGHTLQATALVHEAYLRLMGDEPIEWSNRAHFFAAAAQAMRRILIDRARRRAAVKHGGGRAQIDLECLELAADHDPESWVALDEGLDRLEQIDPRKAQIVMLRFFAGLTIAQTARALELSPTVVKDEWQFARAWLHGELVRDDQPDA